MKYFALISLFALGCSTDPRHDEVCSIYIEPSGFTDTELDIITESVEEWNVALDGMVVFQPTIGEAPRVDDHAIKFLAKQKYGYEAGYSQMRWETAGFYHGNHQSIFLVMPSIRSFEGVPPDEQLKHTVLHEIGHHLGLDHDDKDSKALMTPSGYSLCITDRDITRLRQVYGKRAESHALKSSCDINE